MAKIDITPEDYQLLTELIGRYLPETEFWVFGSRVKATAKPQSDLDLVAFIKPGQRSDFYDLTEAFDESNLPFIPNR